MKDSFYMTIGELKPNAEKVARMITALEARGFKTKDIAEKCEAYPSDVSNWKGAVDKKKNSYLPRKEQYEIMIAMYEHKIPGKKFHHLKVFKSFEFSLPQGWEKRMIENYVHAHEERSGWGLGHKSFEQIEETHFRMLLEAEELGASHDVFVGFSDRLKKAIIDHDEMLSEAKRKQKEEDVEYNKKLQEVEKFITEKTGEEDIEELYHRFGVKKPDGGESLRQKAAQKLGEQIRNGLNLLPRFAKPVGIGESDPIKTDDLKGLAEKMLAEIVEQAKARKAADDARYEKYKLVDLLNTEEMAKIEKEHFNSDISLSDLVLAGNPFLKESVEVCIESRKFLTVPLKTAFKEWISSQPLKYYAKTNTEEVNIAGELLCKSNVERDRYSYTDEEDEADPQFEIYTLHSNRLLLIKKTKWQGDELLFIVDTLTVQDILREVDELAYSGWVGVEYQEETEYVAKEYTEKFYGNLKELLLDKGYVFPGVRTIV